MACTIYNMHMNKAFERFSIDLEVLEQTSRFVCERLNYTCSYKLLCKWLSYTPKMILKFINEWRTSNKTVPSANFQGKCI